MKALVDFISQYEPDYADAVAGVPGERISELESLLEQPLPGAYRDFLLSIGADIGFDTEDVNFDIDRVIDLVRNRATRLPKRFVPIAEDEGQTSWDYYLDLSHPAGNDDALVVRIPQGSETIVEMAPIAWSLRDFLMPWAFEEVRMHNFKSKTLLIWFKEDIKADPARVNLDMLETVMLQMGFQALAVTSPKARIFDREDCAGIVQQVPFDEAFSLKIGARSRSTMLAVAEVVRDSLPRRHR